MKNKIFKALPYIAFVIDEFFGIFPYGMGFALAIYDRHVCCDKGGDHIIYMGFGLGLIIIPLLTIVISAICYKKRNGNESKDN